MYEGRKGIRQMNKAQYEQNYDAAMSRWETPVNQQNLESHVMVPLMIALVVSLFAAGFASAGVLLVADFLSGYSERPLPPVTMLTVAFVLVVWAGSFLFTFLWRIGIGDALLWKLEEATGLDIDGDGDVGIAPRSVPVHSRGGSRDVPLDDKPAVLTPQDWSEVAIAILSKKGNVSWRGIYNNCAISQTKAQAAAKYLKSGYCDGLEINGRGWDWLIAYLPQYESATINRPGDDDE